MLFSALLGYADEPLRPTHPDQLLRFPDQPFEDRFVRVNDAQVAWADYGALRRDFPQLRTLTNSAIDQWVLDHFAFVSERQLGLNGIRNSPIPNSGQSKKGYRPPYYGRAAVLEGDGGGLIDIKGNGLGSDASVESMRNSWKAVLEGRGSMEYIRNRDHSDGLMSLGEAIAEVTRQNAAQKLFDLENIKGKAPLQTVESYFVIALPFDILKGRDDRIPAALYGRQAHVGRFQSTLKERVPSTLYSDVRGGFQHTLSGTAVDFGAVNIEHPALRDMFMKEGLKVGEVLDPQSSNAWDWGHQCARAYRSGDREVVYRHLQEMLARIDTEWSRLPTAVDRKAWETPRPRSPTSKGSFREVAQQIWKNAEENVRELWRIGYGDRLDGILWGLDPGCVKKAIQSPR
jgi:hypothetical protein